MYKPLTHGYKNSAKWWAAIDLLRRFIMILVIAAFPGKTVSQLNILVFVCILISLCVQCYKHNENYRIFYILKHTTVLCIRISLNTV